MAKQNKNTKRTSTPTVQRISKEEFNKLRKRSIRNKVIAGVCTFLVGAGVGAGAYYGISDCWLNKDVPTPPAIEQGQGQTEEPTVSNVKNFASVNDFITDSSKIYTNNYISQAKSNEPDANYVDKDVTLNLPLKLKLFDKTIDGECLGEVNIEKMELKGIYSDVNNITIAYLNITYNDLISIIPALTNYQLSMFDYLNEGKPGQTAGNDFFFVNSGYIFNLNQREPGEPAIRIMINDGGGAELPSEQTVEIQQLEIGVVLQKIA